MAINFSDVVYGPCQDIFGRPVNFTSKLGNSFTGAGRGIYDTRAIDVPVEDGVIMSDQQTIVAIRAVEFSTWPVQGDTISIPAEPISQLPALGQFEIIDVDDNGGGEITLTLRKIVP